MSCSDPIKVRAGRHLEDCTGNHDRRAVCDCAQRAFVYTYGMRFAYDGMRADRPRVARLAICCGVAAYNVLNCVV